MSFLTFFGNFSVIIYNNELVDSSMGIAKDMQSTILQVFVFWSRAIVA